MPGARLGLFALVFFIVAQGAVAAYCADASSPSSDASWMSGLTVYQMFNSPNDYKWERSWDPRYDADWQRHFCLLDKKHHSSGKKPRRG
jgi:hypothetical protein